MLVIRMWINLFSVVPFKALREETIKNQQKISHFLLTHCLIRVYGLHTTVCPRSIDPFYLTKLLYELDQDIQ